MKNVLAAVACICLMLVAGCGSSSSPPLSLSCVLRPRPGGGVRANITLKNSTEKLRGAYVFGPALSWIQHIYPTTLVPSNVAVTVGQNSRSYIAFMVPRVRAKQTFHMVLGFAPPRGARARIGVALSRHIHATNWTAATASGCTIK